MENMKQKIIAIIMLCVVVAGLVWLTMRVQKTTDPQTGKTGVQLFTKKNPGDREVKNQGATGNSKPGDNNGNTTDENTKPVSIIENIINTITGKNNFSGENTTSANSGGLGKTLLGLLLGEDGLPLGGVGGTSGTGSTGTSGDNTGTGTDGSGTNGNVPGIDIPIEITDNEDSNTLVRAECSPGVYVSKLSRKQDLDIQLKLGHRTEASLSDEEKELRTWQPTSLEIDEDNMKRVLHRYWDIWSYPDNYLKLDGSECGSWTDSGSVAQSDFIKDGLEKVIVNEQTIANNKREVRRSFAALSTMVSSTFSVSQSEGQLLVAKEDNNRYKSLINDCRVIRAQFEGPSPYYSGIGSQAGTSGTRTSNTTSTGNPTVINTHMDIARDLARRVKLTSPFKSELAQLSLKAKKLKMEGKELSNAEIARYQQLLLDNRFSDALGDVIQSEVIKNELINYSDAVNILTMTDAGNISYLWDKNNPWTGDSTTFPKNKAENLGIFFSNSNKKYTYTGGDATQGTLQTIGETAAAARLAIAAPIIVPLEVLGITNLFGGGDNIKNIFAGYANGYDAGLLSPSEMARYHLTMYPKLQYGGPLGFSQLRGSTFWSGAQSATNPNPGFYLIKEPQNIWEMLEQDQSKVLYCRLNKFMSMWAGIETNVSPLGYINSHGINCDNQVTQSTMDKIVKVGGWSENDRLAWIRRHLDHDELYTKTRGWWGVKYIVESSKNMSWPSYYYNLEDRVIMPEFVIVNRDNWYSNSVQNAVFEFIKDED